MVNPNEEQYLNLARTILTKGHKKPDRTGTGTISYFGPRNMRFDLSKGFPLLTTKFVPFRLIKSELLWFLHGDSDIRFLLKNNNHIWDEWPFQHWVTSSAYNGPDMTDFGHRAQKDPKFAKVYHHEMHIFLHKIMTDDVFDKKFGSIGAGSYGRSWRHFGTKDHHVDQIKWVLNKIKTTPYSRRLVVSAWNPLEYNQTLLPPCHTLFQFYVNDGKLSCQMYQRSGDTFLGVPFNIASYSLLTCLMAKECGLKPGVFVHDIGDAHIYLNHVNQIKTQLKRKPYKAPKLWLNPKKTDIFSYTPDDIKVVGYKHHPYIHGAISV